MKDGIGCLALLGGFLTGFLVWGMGAGPALAGGFEGEGRNFSVLWVQLPVLLVVTPALTLAVWALLRRRRPALLALALAATLLAAGWLGSEWMATAKPRIAYEQGA
ncbi:hypothetical protein ABZ990_18960 [Streptomyces sp. NPDC046203]|uniref:hypothetical protein n=1 Tax=Streptomyces sp. NPDC046203 TaxID=3154602 RepID=UPI0033D8D7FF